MPESTIPDSGHAQKVDKVAKEHPEQKLLVEKRLTEVEPTSEKSEPHAVAAAPAAGSLSQREKPVATQAEEARMPTLSEKTAVTQKREEVSQPSTATPATPQVTTDADLRRLNHQIHAKLIANGVKAEGRGLRPKEKAVLREIAERLRTLPFAYSVAVEGHTSAGHSKKETLLMAKRAGSFLKKILPGTEITEVGYGTLYPISDDLKNPVNRRIEIIVRRSDNR